MKTHPCILAATAMLLCGCEIPQTTQPTYWEQIQKQQADEQAKTNQEMERAALVRQQYASAHPELSKWERQELLEGHLSIETLEKCLVDRKIDEAKESARLKAIREIKSSPELKKLMTERRFQVGMTAQEVKLSLGEPQKINQFGDAGGTSEQWIYGDTYLYFTAGILKSFQKW